MYSNARLVTAGAAGLALAASLLLPARLLAQPANAPEPTAPAAVAPTAPAPPPEAAPAPGSPSFGEQVEVTEVLLDAQVTDKQGNVIVGLGPGDFKVE